MNDAYHLFVLWLILCVFGLFYSCIIAPTSKETKTCSLAHLYKKEILHVLMTFTTSSHNLLSNFIHNNRCLNVLYLER